MSKNQFHMAPNYGLFIGDLLDNTPHKHYALQISVSNSSPLSLTIDDHEKKSKSYLIHSNIKHKLICESIQLTILINPISALGHFLQLKLGTDTFKEVDTELRNNLSAILSSYHSKLISFTDLCIVLDKALTKYQCRCEQEVHITDDRIINAIKFLDKNVDRLISLKQIAAMSFISESRFLHLFKQKTNLNFRRYQLWNRLVKSIPYLIKHSITATAHQFGFTDSSHYTRTFKETFGVTPKFMIKKE